MVWCLGCDTDVTELAYGNLCAACVAAPYLIHEDECVLCGSPGSFLCSRCSKHWDDAGDPFFSSVPTGRRWSSRGTSGSSGQWNRERGPVR